MKAVTTEQIRQLDQRAIAAGIAGEELMERAGYAVARTTAAFLKRREARAVLLLAGKGNNGGDAIVAARHLAGAGCHPTLVLMCRRSELEGDPLLHFRRLVGGIHVFELPDLVGPAPGSTSFAGGAESAVLQQIIAETDPAVVVDGLLGTGLKGDVREPYTTAIQVMNGLGRLIVAIDIPSGLDSDTGEPHGACVRADATVTMGLPKIGLLKPAATESVGRIEVADIGFPRELVDAIEVDVELVVASDIAPLFPRRRRSAHKGEFGHVLVIAGSEGYTGAPVLAAHAAARAGAGLVTLAVPQTVYPIIAANCPPEVMPRPADFERVDPGFFNGFDAVAIGPGLGQHPVARKLVWEVLSNCVVPLVVDADALNVVAQNVAALKKLQKPLVLTPHPGEMARLVNKAANEVQSDRLEVARGFAREYGVVTVLKGAGTVVSDPSGRLWVNSTGNPGMARGGMGDALTGIIGALLAQKLALADAARAGVFLHGLAGDLACEEHGESAMLTTDLIGHLGAAFARLD
jgi:hydroxyethylthiazole kinase-like uncharacterized protein yjeF